jgi:hypothetical protein
MSPTGVGEVAWVRRAAAAAAAAEEREALESRPLRKAWEAARVAAELGAEGARVPFMGIELAVCREA